MWTTPQTMVRVCGISQKMVRDIADVLAEKFTLANKKPVTPKFNEKTGTWEAFVWVEPSFKGMCGSEIINEALATIPEGIEEELPTN